MELTKEELLIVYILLDNTWRERPLTDAEAILYMNVKQTLYVSK